jgi:hypothetical protein
MAALRAAGHFALRTLLRSSGCLAACTAAALLSTAMPPAWAFAPAALASIGPRTSYAIGAIPAGGYLLVWQDPSRGDFALGLRRFSAAGQPMGAAKLLDVGAPHVQLGVETVAVFPSGAWGVFWVEPSGADQEGIGGALFDAHDQLLRRVSYPDPVPDPGGLIISFHPIAVAVPGAGFLLASEVGTQDDPTADPLRPSRTDVYVMKLDASGNPLGKAVRANESPGGFQHLTGMGGSRDHVALTWDAVPAGPETSAVRARFFDGNLVAQGPEVHVAEPNGSPSGTGTSRLAVGADGSALVVWQGMEAGAGGGPANLGVRLRAFAANGTPAGAERAADTGTPGDHLVGDAGATSDGTVWVLWITPGNPVPGGGASEVVLSLRPFRLAGQPAGGAQDTGATTLNAAPTLTGGRGGALAAWQLASSPLLEGFVVGPPGGQSGPPSAPLAVASADLPGFQTWVRFSPTDSTPIWGTPVDPCLAQALCAAGPVADRAEVILRVIGPRPNGFLWPQIVRFTTDRTEVWVQQGSTGATRYYLLPAGTPGAADLLGRFDRQGFRP